MTGKERTLGLVGVPAGLALAWLFAAASGSNVAVSRHFFYIPVVLAAVCLGIRWTALTGLVAGLLAGPLVPGADFDGGLAFHTGWALRALFLIGVGVLIALLVDHLRVAQAREVALARREQEVARTERDVALQRDAVIQTVSHELRTPLTVIKGGLELLVARQKIDAPLQPLVASMQRSTDRLTSLVSLVLAASDSMQVEEDEPVAVMVAELLRNATRGLPVGQRDRIVIADGHLDLEVHTKPPFVETILRALLDNAVRFSPDGEVVEVRAAVDTDMLEIEIRDHGPGIDHEVLGRWGTPLVQGDQSTTRNHGGLGLGLYTADKLARRLGGGLHLQPHLDGGTVARVILPAPVISEMSARP